MLNEYVNPVLPGDYPDPSVVRVGNDYYLVTSTFQYFPAVLILHSTDLVNWKPIGHVITRKEQLDLTGIPDSYGVFAPDISYYAGKFWVVVPFFHGQPRCTNLLFVADRPEGPYGDPIQLNHHFIDPSIFNDPDGRRYLAYGGGWLHEMAADGSQLIGEAKQVWPGTGGVAPEGPHLIKQNDWYYLILSEGGTFFEHKCTVARSKSIWGPYEANPSNPILQQTDMNKVIQKTGHGKLVQSSDGAWWMMHLGGRPLGPGGATPLGRETFLAPVEWNEDGWFTVGEGGSPVEKIQLAADTQPPTKELSNDLHYVDFFQTESLDPSWEWVRHPLEAGYSLNKQGLLINCLPYQLLSPQSTLVLTRRWEHLGFRTAAKLRFMPKAIGEEAGIMLYRDLDAQLLLTIRNGIGQTSGQSFDVTRLHEQQEYKGLYLQIDQVENGMRRKLYQKNLEINVEDIEATASFLLSIRLDAATQLVGFSLAKEDDREEELPLQVSAEFLYPEKAPTWLCFTAPRIGIFARGVYGTEHGKAVFENFEYEPTLVSE
ncbi:family 43 glycosylhydrolase [Paenibacillus psychroresistens]|nr:family 43 glycosylhydrolase [Paenibacillus psychroresistens]